MKLQKPMKRMFSVAGLLTLSLLAGNLMTARAADPATNVGLIDEAELGNKFTKYRTDLKALEDRAKLYDAQLRAREMLNAAEAKRFDDLLNRELVELKTRTPSEDKELEGLVKTGADRQAMLASLTGKAQKTADEDARLKELQGYKAATKDDVTKLEDTIFDSLKKRDDETNKKYIDMANKMVEKIAIEKKLVAVFRKDAVVWFAPAIDLTDEVADRLNKQ